jgi:hypothetical protein
MIEFCKEQINKQNYVINQYSRRSHRGWHSSLACKQLYSNGWQD